MATTTTAVTTSPANTVKYVEISQATSSKKISPDIEWKNVNFRAGKKHILTNCWGKVFQQTI